MAMTKSPLAPPCRPRSLLRRRRRRPGCRDDHHRQPERPGRRLQRSDARHPGRRQSRHHARAAAPDRLPARGRHLGRDPHQQRADPHRRLLRAAVLHRRQRRARFGRRQRDLVRLHERPAPATWYPSALASKLAGVDVSTPGEPHIIARFNSRLGLFPDCLPGPGFYLGLDNKHGDGLDLVTVLLHEMAHGLGFQTFTDDETGAEILDLPSIWDHYLVDNRSERVWADLTPERARGLRHQRQRPVLERPDRHRRRAASARSALAPAIFGKAPATRPATTVGDASFGPPLGKKPVTGQLMPVIDQPDGSGLACAPLNKLNARAVRGNIALVARGTCAFVDKARNVQAAGAIGMIVADNAAGRADRHERQRPEHPDSVGAHHAGGRQ
jgi:hypothetical protein